MSTRLAPPIPWLTVAAALAGAPPLVGCSSALATHTVEYQYVVSRDLDQVEIARQHAKATPRDGFNGAAGDDRAVTTDHYAVALPGGTSPGVSQPRKVSAPARAITLNVGGVTAGPVPRGAYLQAIGDALTVVRSHDRVYGYVYDGKFESVGDLMVLATGEQFVIASDNDRAFLYTAAGARALDGLARLPVFAGEDRAVFATEAPAIVEVTAQGARTASDQGLDGVPRKAWLASPTGRRVIGSSGSSRVSSVYVVDLGTGAGEEIALGLEVVPPADNDAGVRGAHWLDEDRVLLLDREDCERAHVFDPTDRGQLPRRTIPCAQAAWSLSPRMVLLFDRRVGQPQVGTLFDTATNVPLFTEPMSYPTPHRAFAAGDFLYIDTDEKVYVMTGDGRVALSVPGRIVRPGGSGDAIVIESRSERRACVVRLGAAPAPRCFALP